jgi:hypothetical protein
MDELWTPWRGYWEPLAADEDVYPGTDLDLCYRVNPTRALHELPHCTKIPGIRQRAKGDVPFGT